MDLIYAARYTEICDYRYDDYKGKMFGELPSGIWHVDTASIPEFFQQIKNSKNQYIVVSPSCDYGVFYQKYNHPACDLAKWAKMQINNSYGYNDLYMPARLDKEKCKETDEYIIKCWSYTNSTFNEIPDNVRHWFLVNCEIDHPRVTPIPFGVFGNKDNLENVNKINNYFCTKPKKERNKTLYVNFQFYTTDRMEIFQFLKRFEPINNISITFKHQIPFDEYLDDLVTHKFVLCPTGNGLDCYRTLETIYMGAIPILEQRMGALAPYSQVKYPILHFYNLLQTPIDQLNNIYENIYEKNWKNEIDCTKVLWSYWKNRILSV